VGDDASVTTEFVERVHIEQFGCARDVQLELTRLHALIGPNDSGKSTVLAALRTICEGVRFGVGATQARPDPRWRASSQVSLQGGRFALVANWHAPIPNVGAGPYWHVTSPDYPGPQPHFATAQLPVAQTRPMYGATMVRWDPDAIRQPCELIPDSQPLTVGERGEGMAALYDALLSRDRDAFAEIEAALRALFPTVKGIWLPALDRSKKALGVTLVDGTRVHADLLSEGLLYWLAFAILPHVEPTALLLVEEPENGLHPSRIAEVMKVLRAVSQQRQVILATHSPLVINELAPHEVTILTRDPTTGTRATRMDRTKNFAQREHAYALGELWLSFADGLTEADLVPPTATAPTD
jgi:predicted ATPase